MSALPPSLYLTEPLSHHKPESFPAGVHNKFPWIFILQTNPMSDQNKSVLYSGQQVCPSMAELKNDVIEKAELPTFEFANRLDLMYTTIRKIFQITFNIIGKKFQ